MYGGGSRLIAGGRVILQMFDLRVLRPRSHFLKMEAHFVELTMVVEVPRSPHCVEVSGVTAM
jgi:hypothetical protein